MGRARVKFKGRNKIGEIVSAYQLLVTARKNEIYNIFFSEIVNKNLE